MGQGFYSPATLSLVKSPETLVPKCGICALHKKCRSPKMAPSGRGRKSIMLVGEAPGKNEDEQGKQFVGETGQLLHRSLRKLGIDMREDCVITNALACRPSATNEIKDPRAIEYCRPNVLNAIKEHDTTVIILLGGVAVESLITHLWKDDPGGASRWAGFKIPCRSPNAWVCPTFHPSYISRSQGKRDHELHLMVFEEHLRQAVALASNRPWEEPPPDYASQVECIYDATDAAKIIRKMTQRSGLAAWDLETDRLKPDSPAARIVSCSICWRGKKTIAFPWQGEAITAMKEFLASPGIGKIASNAKFEERWARAKLGMSVRNWKWDTMLMAHVIDTRPKITSIKFQAFVRLGVPDYDGHLKPMLKSVEQGGNAENKIRDIDLPSLLRYNGMDSLLEYEVALLQAKELEVEL